MIRQFLDVVHHAIQMPLRVDLLAPARVQPCEPLVVPDVATHWRHRTDVLAVEAAALGRINGTSHALARMVRVAGFGLEACDLPPTRILRTLQALVTQFARMAIRILGGIQLVAQTCAHNVCVGR